jgi:hypothetical protein
MAERDTTTGVPMPQTCQRGSQSRRACRRHSTAQEHDCTGPALAALPVRAGDLGAGANEDNSAFGHRGARPRGIDDQYPRPCNAAGSGPVVDEAVGVALADAHVPAISRRRIPGSRTMRSSVRGRWLVKSPGDLCTGILASTC